VKCDVDDFLSDKFIVGYIGGQQEYQGINNLESSISKLDKTKISGLFVGGEEDKIQDNIVYKSRVPRKDLKKYYECCDILVIPRPVEGSYLEYATPTKLSEYGAMKKPILATDLGDSSQLVDEYNCGIVISDNSPDSLTAGIKKLSNMPSQELSEMGERSRQMVQEELSYNRMKQGLCEVLGEIYKKIN
jgi:glycosyltransferase involved in cell wall biosynthesis